MSKSNSFETNLLKHIFQNAAMAGIGDAGGLQPSAAAGNLYVSLHTADPGEGGDQATNEATYGGYARKAVARTAAAWPEANGTVSNGAQIAFDACTGGNNAITHFAIGTALSGAGSVLYKGALSAALNVSNGITPQVAAGALTISED